MELSEVSFLAERLLREHGLRDYPTPWSFSFDKAKRRYGQCNHTRRSITMSKVLIPLMKEEDIQDTLLHEIAHALVGSDHGHDWTWVRKAREIGCCGVARQNKHDTSAVKHKYTLTCPKCGYIVYKEKKSRRGMRQSCGKCSRVFDTSRIFEWKQNY